MGLQNRSSTKIGATEGVFMDPSQPLQGDVAAAQAVNDLVACLLRISED